MTTAAADQSAGKKPKKRSPKRLSVEALKERVQERMKNPDYRGVHADNILWDSLEYDEKLRRQMVTIKTVGLDGKLDGGKRRVATSDLQHVRHTEEVSSTAKRKRNNSKRSSKVQSSEA